jgi:hypothetical protein
MVTSMVYLLGTIACFVVFSMLGYLLGTICSLSSYLLGRHWLWQQSLLCSFLFVTDCLLGTICSLSFCLQVDIDFDNKAFFVVFFMLKTVCLAQFVVYLSAYRWTLTLTTRPTLWSFLCSATCSEKFVRSLSLGFIGGYWLWQQGLLCSLLYAISCLLGTIVILDDCS